MIQKSDKNVKESIFSDKSFYCAYHRQINKPYHYHLHYHDFLELLFVRKGYMHATLRNTRLTIKENELLVVMPGELHSNSHNGDGAFEYFVIHADSSYLYNAISDTEVFSQIYPYIFNSLTSRSFLCDIDEMKKSGILPVINRLYSETKKKDPGYSLIARARLLEIIALLLRWQGINSRTASESSNVLNNRRVQPVLDFIKEKYHTKITTNEIADKMNMSVPYFCCLFKKLTGYSFHSYLQSLRITKAIEILLSGDLSIKQIAYQVGYNDTNHFTRVFKKETGMPPDKYRKKFAFPSPFS